jgi:hypothetical protein
MRIMKDPRRMRKILPMFKFFSHVSSSFRDCTFFNASTWQRHSFQKLDIEDIVMLANDEAGIEYVVAYLYVGYCTGRLKRT